jgi:hypothetical protein
MVQAPEGATGSGFPGNGSMGDGAQMGRPDERTTDSDSSSSEAITNSIEESTGFLSGLINMIKGLL